MKGEFRFIVVCDVGKNEYTILRHNLTAKQAYEALPELCEQFSDILIVGQYQKHETADLDECRECRDEVKRQAEIQPTPKFKRRQQ